MTKRILLAVLLLTLIVPFTAWAQEDEEWETYTSEDEAFTLSLPEGWQVYYTPDDFPGMFYLVNSEDLLTRLEEEENPAATMESGDLIMVVSLYPTSLLEDFGVVLEEDEDATALVTRFTELFLFDSEREADDPQPEVGEATLVTLEDNEDFEAGVIRYTFGEENGDGVIVAYEQDDVVFFAVYATKLGEFDEDMQTLGLNILATLTLNVTAEELEAQMMGEPEATAEPGS